MMRSITRTRPAGPTSRRVRIVAVVLAALAVTGAASPAASPKLLSVTLAIRNRVFHQFQGQEVARLNKDFPIGDTDWTGRVVQYVPDFAMDLTSGKVITRSAEPRNPAFKIIVREKGKAVDTTWAMLSLPPHFTRRSYLAFKVMRIEFEGRPPLLADSAAAAKELEALKEAARKAAPPEPEGGPMLTNPHGTMTIPGGASPHGKSPHGSGGVAPIPSHGTKSGSGEKTK